MVTGTGVSTRALVDRVDAGEDPAGLALDYGLAESQIHDAVLYEAAA